MAHPTSCLLTYTFKKLAVFFWIQIQVNLPVFPLFAFSNRTSKNCCHKLHTITNSKDGNAKIEYFLITNRCILFKNRCRSSRKNYSFWILFLYYIKRYIIWQNFAEYSRFSYSSCNQLIILASEIQHNYKFLIQEYHPFLFIQLCLYDFQKTCNNYYNLWTNQFSKFTSKLSTFIYSMYYQINGIHPFFVLLL